MSGELGRVLGKWLELGMLTPSEAQEADETLDLLISLVKLGAISEHLAKQVIDDMAADMVTAWAERSGVAA